jgi:hypothetical protein
VCEGTRRTHKKILEKVDLALNHAQFALGQICQLDLLHSDSLAGAPVESLVHGPEGAFPEALPQPLPTVSSCTT